MNFNNLWKNKKIVAKNTMKKKEIVHGIDCIVKYLESFEAIYGEESGQKKYREDFEPLRLVFIGITTNAMLSYSQVLSSTEQDTLGIQRFEEEALPRNARIYVPQGNIGDFRILEVRDTMKNEGTFVVTQKLVPVIVKKEEFNETLGRNIEASPEITKSKKNTGRNL